MSINSLKNLLDNSTFKTLAQLQALLDEQDAVLKNSLMTRSPYQLLALLILWLITQEECKIDVIKQINSIIHTLLPPESVEDITVDALNTLTSQLNWATLAQELNTSSTNFFKLTLPQKVIANLKVFVDNTNLMPKEFLASIIDETRAASVNTVKITTTINQQFKWIESFDKHYNSWHIPKSAYNLSKGLLTELDTLKKEITDSDNTSLSKQIGVFNIKVSRIKTLSLTPIEDTLLVSILNDGLDELKAKLSEKTRINSGLYSAFEHTKLLGEFEIKQIKVELGGNSYFNCTGVGVEQTQIALLETCCGYAGKYNKVEYLHFDIEIGSVHALFTDSLIAINFPKGADKNKHKNKSQNKNISQDLFISLQGFPTQIHKEPSEQNSYEQLISNKTHNVVTLYSDALSSFSVMAFSYPLTNIKASNESPLIKASFFNTPKIDNSTNAENNTGCLNSCVLL